MGKADEDAAEGRDPRMAAMKHIGGIGVAMLALCIPLSPIIGSYLPIAGALLPLGIVAATVGSMLAVWTRQSQKRDAAEIEALRKQVAELHKRLSNVELIDSVSRRLAEREREAEALPAREAQSEGGMTREG